MGNTEISCFGINLEYLIIILFLIQIILFCMLIHANMKYNRLKRSYLSFMKGKDGKNLENSILDKFESVKELAEIVQKNENHVKELARRMKGNYQKSCVIRYNAFEEMEGNLSFVLTILDGNNNGWIYDSMHNGGACYNYVKEIVRGESYIKLTKEEKECLEKAIYQEAYDIKDTDIKLDK